MGHGNEESFVDMFGNEHHRFCECCAPRYSTMTFCVSEPHKWTKEEIEARIIEQSEKVSNAGFFSRGNELRILRHWTQKLERINEAKENFKI